MDGNGAEVPKAEQRKLPSYDVPPSPVAVTAVIPQQPTLAAYDVPPFAIPVNPQKVSQAGYDFPPFAMPVKPGDGGGGTGAPEAKRLVQAVSRMDSEAERCYAVPPTAVPVNSRNFGQNSGTGDGDGAPQVSRTDSQQDGPQGYALPPTAIPSSSKGLPAAKETKAEGCQGDSPTVASGSSAGLECLADIDHLFLREVMTTESRKADSDSGTGSNRKKSYEILNFKRHLLLNAEESPDSDSVRMFKISVTDTRQCQVMCFYRTVSNSCFPFRIQSMEVFSDPGKLAGRVEEKWSLWNPQFLVKNENGETFAQIKRSSCSNGNLEFEIQLFKYGDVPKGKICQKWDDLLASESESTSTTTTDADNFGFNFPGDLDSNLKIVLIGASFLIKFLYFEKK